MHYSGLSSSFRSLVPGHFRAGLRRGLALGATLVLGFTPLAAAGDNRMEIPSFQFAPPLSALMQKARELSIPVDGLDEPRPERGMRKGDSLTAQVTRVENGVQQQWLVFLAVNELSATEKRRQPKPLQLYTSTGRDLTFERAFTGVPIRTVGPFSEQPKAKPPQDVWSGALVTPLYLALGLESACMAADKLESRRLSFATDSHPFPEARTAAERARNEGAGFGLADERAYVGGLLALGEFMRIVQQTSGLREILFQMLDLPWTSFIRQPPISVEFIPIFGVGPGEPWGLAQTATCREFGLLLKLDGKPQLLCRIAVTSPHPPLQTSGGIVGVAVARADGTGPHLMIRLLAAHCAAETAAGK